MKISVVRRYKRRHRLFSAYLMKNPTLILGLELPFIIVMATSLKNAVALSIQMAFIHMVTMLFAMVSARKLPQWLRVVANVLVATIVMLISQRLVTFMFKDISNSLGMYLSLVAVNGLTLSHSTYLDPRQKLWPVFTKAFVNILVFTTSMLLVSFFRELFGSGTLWSAPISLPFKMNGMLIPFFGFILVGFLMAFVKLISKKLLGAFLLEAARVESRYTIIESGDSNVK